MSYGLLQFGDYEQKPMWVGEPFPHATHAQYAVQYQIHLNKTDGSYMLSAFVFMPRRPSFGIKEAHTERMILKGLDGLYELKCRAKKVRNENLLSTK